MEEFDGADAVEIGVFGGSGFYQFLDDVEEIEIDTPWGAPSAPVAVGVVAGRRVAFIPRHGTSHQIPPHKVPFRANVWAMKELGARRIIGPCAAGSLQPELAPGEFVALDQLVDLTSGRADTFFDGPTVVHVSFADPYCPELRTALLEAATPEARIHPRGTVVVIQGPRFSTRAESAWYRSAGWHVVNMTQYPEAYLARELGICYAGLALITDYDTGLEGVDGIEPVSMEAVFKVLADNVTRTRELLFSAIPRITSARLCHCGDAA